MKIKFLYFCVFSDAPGGVFTTVGAAVAAVMFIIFVLVVVLILVTVFWVKKRKREVNGTYTCNVQVV